MNGIWKRVGMLSLAAGLLTGGVSALEPDAARAYLEVVNTLRADYGPGVQVTDANSPYHGMLSGTASVRLVDFDGDGAEELYCAWGDSKGSDPMVRQEEIWGFDDGAAHSLYTGKVSNFGTDVSPETRILQGEKGGYLVTGRETINGGPVHYYTRRGDEMVSVLYYVDALGYNEKERLDVRVCELNGKTVSEAKLREALDALERGKSWELISYWDEAALTGTAQTIAALQDGLQHTAEYVRAAVEIAGSTVDFDAYLLADNHYFKIRDVAKALEGTAARFAVQYDGATGQVGLLRGRAYEAVGGELKHSGHETVKTTPTTLRLTVDGLTVTMQALQIRDHYYVKLRDLGKALDFGVLWNARTQRVELQPDAPYGE